MTLVIEARNGGVKSRWRLWAIQHTRIMMVLGLTGCESELTVGRAAGGAAACPGCDTMPTERGDAECDGKDRSELTLYESWRSAPNDLLALAGTRWEGYIETGPDVVLTVQGDQSAYLEVGLPPHPSPEKDEGYLCASGEPCKGIDLFDGGIYPIHGGRFDSRRLQLVLNPYSAFDAWCQLQQPKLRPDVVPELCQYDLVWTSTFDSPCIADGREVSCHWLEIARSLAPCACTSGACFSRTEWAPEESWDYGDGFRVDLAFDADEQTLVGSILSYLPCCAGEVFRALRLWRTN